MSRAPSGTAPIKAEYLLAVAAPPPPDDDAAESSTNHAVPTGVASGPTAEPTADAENSEGDDEDGPPQKKQKLTRSQKKQVARDEKKKNKGANTGRRYKKVREDVQLCWKSAVGDPCTDETKCRLEHDVSKYLATKLQDIFFPPVSALLSEPPFVTPHVFVPSPLLSSADAQTTCVLFNETGRCKHGFKCRFLGAHVKGSESDAAQGLLGVSLVTEQAKLETIGDSMTEMNFTRFDLIRDLQRRKYLTPVADAYCQALADAQKEEDAALSKAKAAKDATQAPAETVEPTPNPEPIEANPPNHISADEQDAPDVPMRASEKKRLHWKGLTYLAPLTTVGNLPFRRLCSTLGAHITCSEMALATSVLSGSKEEWSLLRRHPSESIYGVQIAGSRPATLVRAAEVFQKELGHGGSAGRNGIDFVDVNCGCPIDLVYKTGAGSALLDTPGKLGKILIGMNRALGDIPLTIKVRTGVREGKNTAHKLVPRLGSWGIGAFAIHGRTRQQRYSKLADWSYIKECVDVLRTTAADDDLPTIPIFGGGDVYSSEDYWNKLEQSGVDGIMIGRGALIKPWVFTEINERREWDISAQERLEMIRKYAEFGLSHWGTDTVGVNTTRRYLCEALSFFYRYVPIGLLEVLPGRLNDRPPAFKGRNELETLLASPNSRDWVKISEMFLGPSPEGWTFTPKHKSNSHDAEEGNG